MRLVALAFATLLTSCGTPPPAAAPLPPREPATEPTAQAPRPADPPVAGPSAPAAEPPKKTPFTVAKVAPPHARSAQPGDGEWKPVAEVGESEGEPLALRTTLHPHPIRKDVEVVIIAFDLTRSDLVWVAGAKEPESKTAPADKRKGIVPAGDQARLLAAFNGGFMAKHGRFGAMLDGAEFLPPREGACTVAITKAGGVEVGPWEDLAAKKAELAAYRQTPPCLLHGGQPHAAIRGDYKKWGLSAEGKPEIRRTALGVDTTGRVLMFGLGEWVEPKDMELAMRAAGAKSAAQLDINWSYTRFNFYAKNAEGHLEVKSTLVPKLVHGKRSYVGEIAERDFFYVRKK
ncbi:MAG: hypothetical protein HYZ29_16850 [Myxococcales bacterium]|nr:hypothetical protein [Myxococcales bacterium]